ncbi:MAG: hypothetical protein R3277_06915 [Brumimicrobium sp.]|nr:hypothetical protein [Brumimicrobium sp.]
MKYILYISGLIIFAGHLFAQENWALQNSYENSKVLAWDVDPMGKVILSENDVLKKLDTSFALQFSQSSKRFGEITKIDARHSLKTLVFSQNQQLIGFVDNTLTFQKDAKDLSAENIAYATDVCYSGQTNRYWVYDADNSRLILFDNSRLTNTEINNLASLTGVSEPDGIFESHNQLFLFFKDKGIFIFDYYGTLIRFVEAPGVVAVAVMENNLYFIQNEYIIKVNLKTQARNQIALPEKGIKDFRIYGKYIFFLTPEGIKKYILNRE